MSSNVANSKKKLSDRQVLALPHLTSSQSLNDAAQNAGVTPRTVQRWMNDPAFRQEYERQRDEIARYARSGLRALLFKALSIQVERLDSDDPKERARAAQTIMDYEMKTTRTHENQKLIDRLHNLMFGSDNQPTDASTRTAQVDHDVRSFESRLP